MQVFRFATFEFDAHGVELRRQGVKLRLYGQPIQILGMLLEHPGELVRRAELRARLWPADTFVDFEHSLNAAVNKLREALGDSAATPKFIETVPRCGYRFIALVEDTTNGHQLGSVGSSVAAAGRTGIAAGGFVVWRVFAKRHWPLVTIGGAFVAATIFTAAYLFSHRPPKLTPKDPLIVAEFTNTTGDAIFDGALRQGLVAQLQQSPYFDIRSDEQIAETLRRMGQPPGAPLTHQLARQVCQRTGGVAILQGSITQIGSQYQLVLNASDCSSGALLASAQAVASDKNHVLGGLGKIASSVRWKLGESLTSIGEFNKPLEEVTTPSLEALRAYTVGSQANETGDLDGAITSIERAVSLDPNFAMAYSDLGSTYFNLNETSLAAKNTRKAYELREQVSELEKFNISSNYEIIVTGNLEKAMRALELWSRTYDRDDGPLGNLAAVYLMLGQYRKAVAPARRALELDPDSAMNYVNLAVAYLGLDRLEEASSVLRQAEAHNVDSLLTHAAAYELAFLKGIAEKMKRDAGWASGKPGIEDIFLNYESDTAAYAGHLTKANELTANATASARQAGQEETAAAYQAEAGLREALAGNTEQAQKQAAAAWQASNGRHAEAVAALALAIAGNFPRARKLADDLAERFPQDTVAQFNYLPTIRAAIALGQRSPAKAITELQVAAPYELGMPALVIFLDLYPVYVRGQAYLAACQGAAAAAEFQKILDHRGVAFNEVIVPLSYLGLARARVLEGDRPGGSKSYQDFFSAWQNADPDLPILKQAKAEYAKVQ